MHEYVQLESFEHDNERSGCAERVPHSFEVLVSDWLPGSQRDIFIAQFRHSRMQFRGRGPILAGLGLKMMPGPCSETPPRN